MYGHVATWQACLHNQQEFWCTLSSFFYPENRVFHLDPHTTQPTVQVPDGWFIPDSSYHTHQPEHIDMSDLDPSLALVSEDLVYTTSMCIHN